MTIIAMQRIGPPGGWGSDTHDIEAKLTKHELARLHFRWLAEQASDYSNKLSPVGAGAETFEAFDQKEWDWAVTVAQDWHDLAHTIGLHMQRRRIAEQAMAKHLASDQALADAAKTLGFALDMSTS